MVLTTFSGRIAIYILIYFSVLNPIQYNEVTQPLWNIAREIYEFRLGSVETKAAIKLKAHLQWSSKHTFQVSAYKFHCFKVLPAVCLHDLNFSLHFVLQLLYTCQNAIPMRKKLLYYIICNRGITEVN